MKTKVNIFSPGRFHVCDLARELDRNGFDVKFYSFVPAKRAERFGLPRRCSASLFVPMIPFLALWKLSRGASWANILKTKIHDWLSSMVMRKADVCICMSGSFLATPRKAKQKGQIVILERGSKHILEQKRILDAIPSNKGKVTVPDINVKRELAGYEIADYIAVASQHVVDSFKPHNYPTEKLFVNPYGVDLSDFYPIDNVEKKYDLIMAGGWCYRKGCDLIVEAVRQSGCSFLHVGAIGDFPFPDEPNFAHHDAVDQKQLVNYYNQAKVMVFPSREEGLAMVQAQAIACNIPLVGSHDSGAEDLKRMVEFPEYITIISEHTPEAVAVGIKTALTNYDKLEGKVYAGDAISNLTWEAYGKRYASFLKNINTGGVIANLCLFKYDLIMVGGWCYRKGCDLIVEAVKQTGCSFLHVGAIGDMPFPQDDNFTHHDAVDQKQLVNFYNQAKVFILPSREDGFGMVFSQAAACNLPIIGSRDSGAPDLKRMVEYPEYITIIEEYTVEAVVKAINVALSNQTSLGNKKYIGNAKETLSWAAYGKRYAEFISSKINNVK